MIVYSDHLDNVREAFNATGLGRDGVYLEDHGPMSARKRAHKFVVKLSADRGVDRFGTERRWANSGQWGAATPQNGYPGEPLGEKAATFDEWGVFIAELFRRDPGAIVGIYNSPTELYERWTEPPTVPARKIASIDRLKSSVNGNPRFRITFTDGSSAQTMSDAMFGYAVGNPDMREGCPVKVEFTKAGRIRHMEPAA